MIVDHGPAGPELGKRLRIMSVMRITKIVDLGMGVFSRVCARAGVFMILKDALERDISRLQ